MIELPQIILFLIGASIGFIIGFISCSILHKKNHTTERLVSLLIIGVWTSFHIIAFIYNKDVAWIFDIMGAGAFGHLIGLDTLNLFKLKR